MRCIFCKENSQSSVSIEHIIPESIGNQKYTLPKGLVCDKCNSYFSRKVENPILSHQSIRNIRGLYQVPTKKNKYPSIQGYISGTEIKIAFKLGKNKNVIIVPENLKDKEIVDKYISLMKNGKQTPPFVFPIYIDPPKKEMSRFLAKMGFETLVNRLLSTGTINEIIYSTEFDMIRNYARYGMGIEIWPFHQRAIFPQETKMKHPETGKWVQVGFGHDLLITNIPETYFIFLFYGVEFVINLGGPSIKGYELWLQENNYISPFIERGGAKLVEKVIDGKINFFLEGDYSIQNGIMFDKNNYMKLNPCDEL